MEMTRFTVVALLGLALDIAIAWAMVVGLNAPLAVGAIVGFCCAAAFNYALHELWTFRGGARQLSGWRSIKYIAALVLTLGTRLGILAVLVAAFANYAPLLLLAIATAGSFLVNYAASRFLVFRANQEIEDIE